MAFNASIAKKNAKLVSETPSLPLTSSATKPLPELHVPYLDNRLTHFLKESLGGSARTVLIANIGPEGKSYNVNLHCLQYAAQAMKIGNLIKPIHIDIPHHIEADPISEISIIKQLKQKILDPLRSPVKMPGRVLLPPSPSPSKRTKSSYSLVVHSFAIANIPYICLPCNPWIHAEVGSVIHKTTKAHYSYPDVALARFPEEMCFEVNDDDHQAGIEVSHATTGCNRSKLSSMIVRLL